MKIYYIYHIDGVKIGCTSELEHRMRQQGFTDWEVLEQYEDIHVASDREIELQKQYGYRVDSIPYWQTLKNRDKFDALYNSTKRLLTMQQAEEIRAKYVPYKYSSYKLAREYGVLPNVIAQILKNNTYIE